MTLSDVKAAIARAGSMHDPEALFAAFFTESGSSDPDLFLAYVLERGVIEDSAWRELPPSDPIDPDETLSLTVSAGVTGAPGPAGVAAPAATPAERRRRHVVLGTAGRGGMGTVYVAKDVDLLRKVALKELPPGLAATELRGRFVKEVRITAQLDHPNIVPVYSLEVSSEGVPSYSMKLVQGKTFADFIEEARLAHQSSRAVDDDHALPARLDHFLRVCEAVAYAHGKGVVHRDLKPLNLMLGQYKEVYVMDWGLCAITSGRPGESAAGIDVDVASVRSEHAGESTRIGSVVGTPAYMAPEQAAGRSEEVGPLSDQYSLGLILFEMVTLQPAIDRAAVPEMLQAAAEGRKRRFEHAFGEPLSSGLRAIVAKATAVDPAGRYESVAALAEDVRRHLRGDAVAARPDTALEKIWRAMSRHRMATLAALAAVVLLSALGVLASRYEQQIVLERQTRSALQLASLVNAVSGGGDHLQTYLLAHQERLEGFASLLSWALAHDEFGGERYYLAADFAAPARRPADLRDDPRYLQPTSFEQPVWLIPPTADQSSALDSLRRLSGLRAFQRQIFDDISAGTHRGSAAKPLIEIRVGLDNGLASLFPGADVLPADYDPRGTPWYKLSSGSRGPRWGAPYPSPFGDRPMLSCSQPIVDAANRQVGVVNIPIDLDYLAEALVSLRDVAGVSRTYLIDDHGTVVASWSRLEGKVPGGAVGDSFGEPAVVQAIQAGRGGSLERREGIYAFDVIDPLRWGLVAIADPGEIYR